MFCTKQLKLIIAQKSAFKKVVYYSALTLIDRMKPSNILIAVVFIIALPACSFAQRPGPMPMAAPKVAAVKADTPTPTTLLGKDGARSLEVAKNMLVAAHAITNYFADIKGDFVQKDAGDNAYYKANGPDLGADSQYVVIRANGDPAFIAIFKDDNAGHAFASFTAGIVVERQSDKFTVIKDDTMTQEGVLKYFLKLNDIKLASYTFDIGKKQGTFLVAIQ
jgi:hypothetical protein